MTIAECAAGAAGLLARAGFSDIEARTDVSVLARHALGWTMADWVSRATEQAPGAFEKTLLTLAQRRATREPVAYITGVREFYGRPFRVTPAVLIPRPETEIVVEEALQAFGSGSSPAIVDVGTGSGCIAITLGLERPDARVTATDVSPAALDVARANARELGAANVEFVHQPLIPPGRFDLVVSNPPYVSEDDRESLARDVRDFEPAAALFAGGGGLDVIRPLVAAAEASLEPGGALIMEIGIGQADAVTALARQAGFLVETIRRDLQGIPRVVVARRPAAESRSAT